MLQGSYSQLYKESIKELGRALSADSMKDLKISGPGSQLMKAAGVRNQLVKAGSASRNQITISIPKVDAADQKYAGGQTAFMPREDLVLYEPDHTLLFLNTSYLFDHVQSWAMQITDIEGKVVKTFNGSDTLPASLTWDWRSDEGQHIAPGVYRYGLEWVDSLGNAYQSNKRKLYVQKMLRKITIEITRDIEAIREEADAVEIRIQH